MVFKVWMLSTIYRARIFGAILAIALFCAAGTAVADSPIVLGNVGANGTDGGSCTAYGYSVAGQPYNIPYDGVLTKYQVMTGFDTSTTSESVRLRTVHSNGSLASAHVASEGTLNSVRSTILPTNSVGGFDARVPAAAGDHLAIGTTTDSNYAGRTHCTAIAPSEVGHTGRYDGNAAKDVNLPWVDAASRIPNVQAMLEPDADQDGYGDGSQDLCPANAALYFYSCTGVLFGTNTALTPTVTNMACAPAFNCLRVQTAIGDISTAAPYRGVVVRWRASSGTLANMRIRVVKPTDSTHFQIVRSSDSAAIAASPAPGIGSMPAQMTIVPTRVPIEQGDFVGLDIPSGPGVFYGTAIPGSTYYDLANTSDGGSVGKTTALDKQIFYNADIERDADGDGYGDETQDLCPTDATRQTLCASTDDTTPPSVSGFTVSPKRFKVAGKGTVISKKTASGTKFKLKTSDTAGVTFTVYRVVKKKLHKVHAFIRPANNGKHSFSYSGRYRVKSKTRKLSAGSYKVTVTAVDLAGNRSSKRTASFTVVR
jgi:hypothetical protein